MSFKAALTLLEHNFAGRFGRAFEYDFQRVEQPNFLVTGTGSLTPNPERYLNEHTLKFQFSEIFPSSSSYAALYKAACALSGKVDECKGSYLATVAGANGWWRRGLSGLSLSGDLSERSALQQGVVVTNPSFSNHYQLTGGFDFDPTQLFINGTNWSKAAEDFGAADEVYACACTCRPGTTRHDCIRDLSRTRITTDYTSRPKPATEFLAAVVPIISFKRVSQFDFVKNGGVLVSAPFLERAQNQLTFKWDLKKSIVPPTALMDAAGIKPKKAVNGSPLCVVIVNSVPSFINVPDGFPASSCADFATKKSGDYELRCVMDKTITNDLRDPQHPGETLGKNCWNSKSD